MDADVNPSFVAFSGIDETKQVLISHRCSLLHCTCTTQDDSKACTAHAVGWHLVDFCTSLGLDPALPIFLTDEPSTPLEIANSNLLEESMLIIPVHKTSRAYRGFRN